MIVDINKLNSYTAAVRFKFESNSKQRKFIRQCLAAGYTGCEDIQRNIDSTKVLLMFNKCLVLVTNLGMYQYMVKDYNEFLIKEAPKSKNFADRFRVHHNTLYITKDIDNSDLSLRYYIHFGNRPSYENKWFIKDRVSKQYMEIPEDFAKHVSKTMCSAKEFKRVLGFPIKGGFKRVVLEKDNVV